MLGFRDIAQLLYWGQMFKLLRFGWNWCQIDPLFLWFAKSNWSIWDHFHSNRSFGNLTPYTINWKVHWHFIIYLVSWTPSIVLFVINMGNCAPRFACIPSFYTVFYIPSSGKFAARCARITIFPPSSLFKCPLTPTCSSILAKISHTYHHFTSSKSQSQFCVHIMRF